MINKVTLIGRLGKDPEIRTNPQGKKVASITLATSEQYKDKQTGAQRIDRMALSNSLGGTSKYC